MRGPSRSRHLGPEVAGGLESNPGFNFRELRKEPVEGFPKTTHLSLRAVPAWDVCLPKT
jgi:hypothetical protein